MKYYLSVFVGLIYFLFPSFSFAYEATCTFEYGLVDSGTFDISVNQGMLTQRFKPTSVGNTSIPERTNCRVYELDEETKKKKLESLEKAKQMREEFLKRNDNVSQEQR